MLKNKPKGLLWWLSGKESTCSAGEAVSVWVRQILWTRNGNPLQYSCLGNSTDGGAWQAIVHGVAKESDST